MTVSPLGGPASNVVSAQATGDPGGEFHALTPTRILDTRPGLAINDVNPTGAKKLVLRPTTDKTAEFKFNPLGKGGLPGNAGDVLAIVANITVTQPTSDGYLAVYPSGFKFGGNSGNEQVSSLINFLPGADVPNLAIVGLGADGTITINGKGDPGATYHVIIDILGFISTSQYDVDGARLATVTPTRILDTRKSSPISGGNSIKLAVRGADSINTSAKDIVPNRASVSAVLVNLTLVNDGSGNRNTHVTATPNKISAAQGKTNPSNSNVAAGRIKANMTVVPIASDGSISLYNNSGKLDLVVDVLGYFETGGSASTNKGRVVPLEAPFRAFDTRESAFGDAPLGTRAGEDWSFDAFTKSVTLNPGASNETVAPKQQALIGDLVAVNLQHPNTGATSLSSFLRFTPGGSTPTETSNINYYIGDVVPNMSLIKYGGNKVVTAYNHYGNIDYLLDVYAIVLDD
jgi:hypothetical protein